MVPEGILVPDSQPFECEEEKEDDDDGIDGLLTTKQVRELYEECNVDIKEFMFGLSLPDLYGPSSYRKRH